MPLIYTKGVATAQGFGLFSRVGGADGTKGIFALGLSTGCSPSTTRNKYTYASCTSTACGVGSASASSYGGSAAGNSTRGIFALGYTTNYSTTRNKYTYACCSSTASGVAASSVATSNGSATGNSTRGIFAIGEVSAGAGSAIRNKYTYASCTSTACGVASASATGKQSSAAGNSTRGIFALGLGSCNYLSTRNKYTYASCTSTACGVGVASDISSGGSAAGNSTRGIFALGYVGSPTNGKVTTRNKYTYSNCTSTASGVGAASVASYYGAATGNSTRGIFAIGATGAFCTPSLVRNKYTYACCTSTAIGVGVASAVNQLGSAASWATCVNT